MSRNVVFIAFNIAIIIFILRVEANRVEHLDKRRGFLDLCAKLSFNTIFDVYRVVMVKARYSCGLLAMEEDTLIVVIATAILTAFSPCLSRVPRKAGKLFSHKID